MSQEISAGCPACLSMDIRRKISLPDHEYALAVSADYVQCDACGSFYQMPMPDPARLASYYPKDYHSFETSSAIGSLKHAQRLRRLVAAVKSRSFVMLDYGCGSGSFLHYAAERLPQARLFGYDISETSEIHSSKDDRIVIIRGSFEDLMRRLPDVDLIDMHHVIEHLPDPLYTISRLYKRLKSNGMLIGQTPASDSLERDIFGAKWSGFHAPRHTVIFSRRGVRTLLHRIGFADALTVGAFNPGALAVSFASLPHGDRAGRIRRSGPQWLFCVGLGTLFSPVDLLSGRPGIMDFYGRK